MTYNRRRIRRCVIQGGETWNSADDCLDMSLKREISELPAYVWVLFGGAFINRFGNFVLVFLVLYVTRLGYTAPQAGLAVGAYGVGSMLAAWIGGVLADLFGRRETIALSMFSSAAVMLTLSQASSLGAIIGLAILAGATAELNRPAATALLTDLTKQSARLSTFALYRLALNLGAALGPATGGFLADTSFTLIFVGDALSSTIFGILSIVALPRTSTVSRKSAKESGSIHLMFRRKELAYLLIAATAGAVVYMQARSTFPLQVVREGFTNTFYGILISINGLIVVATELPMTLITRRYAPRVVIGGGLLLIGIGYGLLPMAAGVVMLGTTVVVWSLGEIIYFPTAMAYVSNLASVEARGRYQGALAFAFAMGQVIGPVIGTWAFSIDPNSWWFACLALCGLSAALMFRSTGSSDKIQEPPG